jgi:hypothetical protein
MNGNEGIVRTQVDALKELLEKSRNAHCREVHERADLQANEIRRRARRQARERVSRAAVEERTRLEREVRMVQAEIETEHRRRARQRDMALIEAGRDTLAAALAARWEQQAERTQWAESAVLEAGDVLLGKSWVLEHPPGWPDAERDRALALARERFGVSIEARADEGLDVGLRIRTGGALVDLSIPGLMANERSIEGELLAEFGRTAAGVES